MGVEEPPSLIFALLMLSIPVLVGCAATPQPPTTAEFSRENRAM